MAQGAARGQPAHIDSLKARVLAQTQSLATIANDWLATFEKALAGGDDVLLKTLFHPESHWRDVLALTWHIRTVNGLQAVLAELKAHAGRAHPSGFRTDPQRTAPRHVRRAGADAIEALFRFETDAGRGSGVLRLVPGATDRSEERRVGKECRARRWA